MTSTTSCDRKVIYSHYKPTQLSGWEKNDMLSYELPRITEAGDYEEVLGLRVDKSYPFMGLCLIIQHTVMPSGRHYTDTLNCSLIDEGGHMKAPGFSYHQYRFPVGTLHLEEGDSLHVTVHHNMKREIIPGISDVGLSYQIKH